MTPREGSREICGAVPLLADLFRMSEGALLIDRGDLASLVCLALEPERGQVMIWPVTARPGPRRAVTEHAEAYGIKQVLGTRVHRDDADMDDGQGSSSLRDSLLLLEGAKLALEHGCTKLIWPALVGGELEHLANEVARVQLVSSLSDLDDARAPASGRMTEARSDFRAPVIEMPVVDLSDGELVDLGEDAGAPMRAFWPCMLPGEAGAEPCGRCAGCRRWSAAFAHAGVAWPWEMIAT